MDSAYERVRTDSASAEAQSSLRSRMVAVALALASSLTWGSPTSRAGLLTRRMPLAAVTIVSQAAGFVLLLASSRVTGHVDGRSLWIGAIGGLGGGAGLACFYAALARGTMSIVSPITACSAVVPVALSLATGERPSALALAGSAVALAGAVLASVEERSRRRAAAGATRSCSRSGPRSRIGCFVFFLGKAAQQRLGAVRAGRRSSRLADAPASPGRSLRAPACGSSRRARSLSASSASRDLAANALFALASQRGLLAVVSVLGSLYPVATVVLAHVAAARAHLPGAAAGCRAWRWSALPSSAPRSIA